MFQRGICAAHYRTRGGARKWLSRLRWSGRLGAVVLVALTGGVWGAAPAVAHTALVSSRPAADEQVLEPPLMIELTFNEDVNPQFATVAVLGPGDAMVDVGTVSVRGRLVSAPIEPVNAAGPYQVSYRVVSNDGHPVTGQFRYQLSRQSSSASEAAPTPTATAPSSPNDPQSEAISILGWSLVVGIALVGIVVVATLIARRRRAVDPSPR